jgi:hypothetical protein
MLFLKYIMLGLLICFSLKTNAQDSIANSTKRTLILTTKLHSTGHFPYSGSLLNHHVNGDVSLFFQKQNWGFFVFKALDFEDLQSDVNYLQTAVFRKTNLTRSFSLTPYAGYLFLQNRAFADFGSDVFMALSTTVESQNLMIENTTLITNVFNKGYQRAMANRMEIRYAFKPMHVSWFIWHNMGLPDNGKQTLSTALAFRFPKVRWLAKIPLQSTLLFQSYLSNYKPDYAMRRGVVFSCVFPVAL